MTCPRQRQPPATAETGVGQTVHWCGEHATEQARRDHHNDSNRHQRADRRIMEEPTSALSLREINDLFIIVRELKEQGVAISYISHHLEETFALADRITVLRDGHLIATRRAAESDFPTYRMIGRCGVKRSTSA